MIENSEKLGTITLQASGDPELKSLLQTLIEKQNQTNLLLERIAERGEKKEMLSHKEAAAFLNIHVSTLQKLMGSEIPVFRIRGVKRYKREDLQAWLDMQAEKKVTIHKPEQ